MTRGDSENSNDDKQVIAEFGEEWCRFNHSDVVQTTSIKSIFDNYLRFDSFFDLRQENVRRIRAGQARCRVLDLGCGSGRWSYQLADLGFDVVAVEPSAAWEVAQINLKPFLPERVSVLNMTWQDLQEQDIGQFDLVLCLGVIHHLTDDLGCLRFINRALKPGGHFVGYVYYALDNRPKIWRVILKAISRIRVKVSMLPSEFKFVACDILFISVYLPLILWAKLMKFLKLADPSKIPLGYYADQPLFIARTDARDRFGTSVERRYTRHELMNLLTTSGFRSIEIGEGEPFYRFSAKKR